MTLNQVTDRIQEIATSHGQVNYYFFGDPSDYLSQDEIPRHTSVLCTIGNASFDGLKQSQTSVSFTLFVMDWCGLSQDSEREIWSDTLQIAHDIIAELQDETANNFYLSEGITLKPFTERFEDSLTGWEMEITITYDSELDRCAIPGAE